MLKQTIMRTVITGAAVMMLVSTAAAPAIAAPAYDTGGSCPYIIQWWRCK